ncbi:hypothetical protein [Gimesia sp.]|uniref:hypothetical protein n=1 Tax=Gimesia sp. TaxID=2024833 RepID=UPI0032F03EE9
MTDKLPQEYQQIFHQIHSDIVLGRLRDYLDPDGDVPEIIATDLNDLAQRLLVDDAPASIDRKDIKKLLKDDAIRELLKQSIRHLTKSQSKEET